MSNDKPNSPNINFRGMRMRNTFNCAHIVQRLTSVISKETSKLRILGIKAADKAHGLWQAVVICCQCFNITSTTNQDVASCVDVLGLRLETFLMPTSKLRELLDLVVLARWNEAAFRKLAISEAIVLVQSLVKDRRCGSSLRDSIAMNHQLLEGFSETLRFDAYTLTPREKALKIAQYLMDLHVIECVEIPSVLDEIRQPGYAVVRSPPPDQLPAAVLLGGSRMSFDGLNSPHGSDESLSSEQDEIDTLIMSFHGDPWTNFLPVDSAFYAQMHVDPELVDVNTLDVRLKEIIRVCQSLEVYDSLQDDALAVLDSKWLLRKDADAYDILSGMPNHAVPQQCSCPF